MEDSTLASTSTAVTLTNFKSALRQPMGTELPTGDDTATVPIAIEFIDGAATASTTISDLTQTTSTNQNISTTVPDTTIQTESIIHNEEHPVPSDETTSSMESPPIDL